MTNALFLKRLESQRTELGRLFLAYENLTASAWQLEGNDNISDRRLREAWGKANAAREEFLVAIGAPK